ncbi:MAG: ribosome small subunit-dependent GTPase A [Candidatus Zixiibacteriota bacterium]|nr:MAG: ribosome small subunit-dependent GTPase A [candidate division Zixibacteria bacterium]
MSNDNLYSNLIPLGWNQYFKEHFAPYREQGMIPGRIEREHKNLYSVAFDQGQINAEVSGRFRNAAQSRADFPAVGDWVAMKTSPGDGNAIIHAILPRISCFSRKAILSGGMPDTGGKTDEQVLAANIDTVFLVSGLDGDFNLRRIERYVITAYNSGATAVIVLNKADLCDDIDERIQAVESVAVGVPVLTLSAATGDGLDGVGQYVTVGKTIAFMGSSGVGKSTIINALLGEERLATNTVREYDSKGRHTTSHRELIVLPEGGIVIDTPGMRELQLWGDENGLGHVFDDIETLARQCRFDDCSHTNEPGCAVLAAIDGGQLDRGRFANYLKLQKEIRHMQRRKNVALSRRRERARDKRYRRFFKEMQKINKKFQSR